VEPEPFEIRPAEEADRRALAELLAAVAAEGDRIAAELPLDVEKAAANVPLEGTLVAVSDGELVGRIHVDATWFGYGEIGMMVVESRRGQGIGTALVLAAADWARERGLHKLTLGVFPSNDAAIGLYRKLGFADEGLRMKQIRRRNGELWDLLEMGLLL
jgi:putative acetyltransferase